MPGLTRRFALPFLMTVRLTLLFVVVVNAFTSCGLPRGDKTATADNSIILTGMENEILETRRYNFFDTVVDVEFPETRDSISPCQRNNVETFFQKQDSLSPRIAEAIFEYYRNSYGDQLDRWMARGLDNEEIERSLPKPTTAQALMKNYTPMAIYIQNAAQCVDGSVGIGFYNSWDERYAIGVKIKNWKEIEVGTQHVAFFP